MPTESRPQAVTTARRSRREDRNDRLRGYLIAMSIRIASFPLAVWALSTGHIIIGSILAAAAVLLPSFAVMLANNVDQRQSKSMLTSPVRALPPTPRRDDL
ncbi:MAG: DUF3099 domain-containing protein [Ornithinimicrobium sp.]